jgi:DNA-binding SARP family transcriptional activator
MVEQIVNYRICLLGKPMVYVNDIPMNIKRKKCRGLVYFLAAENKPMGRERLQDIFWPDQDICTAPHNLNVHLYEIRRQMPNLIISDNDYIQINPQSTIDTHLFDYSLTTEHHDGEQLQKTLSLYQGDFLEGFSIGESVDFDNWKVNLQEYYLTLYIRGLAKSAEYYHSRGEYDKGITVLKHAIKIDPLKEELYRSEMLIHYNAGDLLKVSQTYKKLKRVLDEEMGLKPMKETQALYDAMVANKPLQELGYSDHKSRRNYNQKIKNDMVSPARVLMPFIGRDKELHQLDDLSNTKGLVIIGGTPGVGKTRLIEEYMRTWEGLVLYVKCLKTEKDIPYLPVIEAIRKFVNTPKRTALLEQVKREIYVDWWNELRRIVPEIDLTDINHSQLASGAYGKMQAITQFITILSRKGKLLFLIDDLQWADDETLGLINYLVQQCVPEDIYFLGTQRLIDNNPKLITIKEFLSQLNLLKGILLKRLDHESIKIFAKQITNIDCTTLAEWLERITTGNAFQLTEFIYFLKERIGDSKYDAVDIQTMIDSSIIPPAIESYLLPGFVSLSQRANRVLEAASVYGNSFIFKILIPATGLSETEALDGLEELMHKGYLVINNDHEYVFDHSLVREVAYKLINPARRQWIHLKIAEALERNKRLMMEPVDPFLAFHYEKSSQPEKSIPFALKAGDDAAKVASWSDALKYYKQASKYSEDFLTILEYLTEMYINAGEMRKFDSACSEGAAMARKSGREDLYVLYSLESHLSKIDNIEEYHWGLIPCYPELMPPGLDAWLIRAHKYLQQPINDNYLMARFYIDMALIMAAQGELEKALDCYQQVVNGFTEVGTSESYRRLLLTAQLCLGIYSRHLEKPKAKEVIVSGLQLTRDYGILYLLPAYLCEYGRILMDEADCGQVLEILNDGLHQAQAFKQTYLIARIKTMLGNYYIKAKDKQKAIQEWKEALAILENINACQPQVRLLVELIKYSHTKEKYKYRDKIVYLIKDVKSDLLQEEINNSFNDKVRV